MVIEFAPPRAVAAEDADGSIARFAEVLRAYDERYKLQYIPEADAVERSVTEILKPYRIIERTAEKGEAIVRYLTHEDMKRPDRVLAWVYEGDFRKHSPQDVYDRMKAEQRFDKALEAAKKRDEAQARQDLTAFLVAGGRERKNRVQLGRGHYFDRSR